MVVREKPIVYFKKAISLLQQHPECEACLAYGRVAGWNYAFVEEPLTVTAVWNAMLPKKIWVGHEAFEDKGVAPDPITSEQREIIRKYDGVPTDPMAKGFDPFYTWKFPEPDQSPIFIERQRRMAELKAKWYKENGYAERKMKAQRYWGD